MSRLLTTVLSLLMTVGLGSAAAGCSCASGDVGGSALSMSPTTEATSGESCCPGEESDDDGESRGCCDDENCSSSLRDGRDLTVAAQLGEREPDAELPVVSTPVSAFAAPSSIDRPTVDSSYMAPATAGASPTHTPSTPRYLALQVLRL